MAYSTDTRTLRPGDTYVAVRGETHDGHAFVDRAVELGAAALIVDERSVQDGLSMPDGIEAIVVPDTVEHLSELASARVRSSGAKIVAITGSVGKTTTKSSIVAVLAEAFPVVFAKGNLNTPLGLSLTVLNADLDGPSGTTKIVMEMGARMVGDIAELCALFPPAVSVVTNVKAVHLETFGSIEAIEAEKGELIANLAPGGVGVLNADDGRVMAMSSRTSERCVTYGTGDGVDVGPADVTVALPILGVHGVTAAMAATAVGRVFEMTTEQIDRGLMAIQPEAGRLARLRGRGGSTLIDDTYNASPDATIAALDVLMSMPVTRRLAALGDMLELGPDEIVEHRRVLAHALATADQVIAVGPRMAEAAPGVGEGLDRLRLFADSTQAATAVRSGEVFELTEADALLVKGSQGLRMERVSEAALHPDLDPAAVLARQSEAWKAK